MNSPGFSNRSQNKNNICINDEKNIKTDHESDNSEVLYDYFYDFHPEENNELETSATKSINYNINNKQTTEINSSMILPPSSQTQPSPKSLDQKEIAGLRDELERIKRDLQSQQKYTEALGRQVVGSDCSLDTVYSDESIENILIYSKDIDHMNEDVFLSFSDSEVFKQDKPLTEDFKDVKQIPITDSDQMLKENLINKDDSDDQQKYYTPISKQSQRDSLIVKTPRTPYAEKLAPQSKVLGTPKITRRAHTPKDKNSSDVHKKYTPTLKQTPRRSAPLVEKPVPQSKLLETPKTTRRAYTSSKTIANTTQIKQGTSRVTTKQSKVKSKCVATTTPTSGPYSSPLAYKNKQPSNQKMATTPKTGTVCLHKTAKTNKAASTSKPAQSANTRTPNKTKTNIIQPKRGISIANAACSVTKNKRALVETSKSRPYSTSTSKKSIEKKSELKKTPHTSKTTTTCTQKSPTKFNSVTTPVPSQCARTQNKMKTNSTRVTSGISGANSKQSKITNKCKYVETARSETYSPPQKSQCKIAPQYAKNTTALTQELVSEPKGQNISTPVPEISTGSTSRSETSTTINTRFATTNEGKISRYPTPYARSIYNTYNPSEISTIRSTRSATTNEAKVSRSRIPYPRGTYNPSSHKETTFFAEKQELSHSDLIQSTPLESKMERDESHNENSSPNALKKLNTGSSFCVHCLNDSKTVIKNFLTDELQKIVGNHQKTNVILTTTLQKNGLYHINISLKPNGDHLGCLYTDKQSIMEAGMEDEFKHYLNLFVASDPNTIDEHHAINFDIQFASYKT